MTESLPRPQCCVFDLDGTLVDSLADIADACNTTLSLLGLPPFPPDSYRQLAGEGLPRLCEKAIGQTHPHLVTRMAELVRAVYRTRAVRKTRPFTGLPEVLKTLRLRGIRLAVLSNKPHDLTRRVVAAFWPAGCFEVVQGQLLGGVRKPDPTTLRGVCERMDVGVGDTWLVGDTATDMLTAANAGAVGVGVTWGFRDRVELAAAGARQIVDRPAELLRLL